MIFLLSATAAEHRLCPRSSRARSGWTTTAAAAVVQAPRTRGDGPQVTGPHIGGPHIEAVPLGDVGGPLLVAHPTRPSRIEFRCRLGLGRIATHGGAGTFPGRTR
jgi:hypothetical protein